MAVDPWDGAVYVVFYDRRGDPKEHEETVVLARSTDGGQTFHNYSWMDQGFDAKGAFLGDYSGIAALNGRVYGIWSEKPADTGPRDSVVRIGIADFNVAKR
jgi:hypothetical protein